MLLSILGWALVVLFGLAAIADIGDNSIEPGRRLGRVALDGVVVTYALCTLLG